ncbi:MAG: cold-shock protein [Sphingomonadales bacterium]|jgi:CspA family cold shock protein
MPQGTVKWFNSSKGFGFIKPDDSDKDAFVHITAVQKAGLTELPEGQRIEYELVEGRNGRAAADELKLID